MQMRVQNLFLLPVLMAGLCLIPTGRLAAQTFNTLYSFTGGSGGAESYAGLVSSGNRLYGTVLFGGNLGNGAVFAINTNGVSFTNVYVFNVGGDGANSTAELILSGNTLYGTASEGGSSGAGAVFKVNTDGTDFTNLYSFTSITNNSYTNSDGANPEGGLILSGNTLYGTTFDGGFSGNGTVFAVNTDGTGFTNLHNFATGNSTTISGIYVYTNSDGANPGGNLLLSGSILYGTTPYGCTNGNGTVFAVNTDGTGFTNLYTFTSITNSSLTNRDGANPQGGLVLSGNTLYGTASGGGSSGNGTVFAINTDGTGYTNLYNFTATSGSAHVNTDGANPQSGLILSANTLYGTASNGGASGNGTLFAINTNGAGFTTLYSFTGGSDGADPLAGLILSGNTLYGTTPYGSYGYGTVFSLSPPQLALISSGANIVLTWPTNGIGFILQSTTNLSSAAGWSAVSPAPVVVNGRNTVTNAISSTPVFYRLGR